MVTYLHSMPVYRMWMAFCPLVSVRWANCSFSFSSNDELKLTISIVHQFHFSFTVRGYFRSHSLPSLGNYLLRIAPAAARAKANKTMMIKCNNFAGHFDGHGGAPVQYRMHCPIEEVQGFIRSQWMPPLDASIGQELQPILAISHAYAGFFSFFIVNS
jgi:hypothetical protein